MKNRILFVSHSWKYSERYDAMIRLLKARPYFDFKESSVPSSKALEGLTNAQLKLQLTRQIAASNCVVIIGGMWTSYSDWIQYEINEAQRMRKPILGVKPRGAKVMPAAVTMAANKVVSWQTDLIAAGIRSIS